MKIGIDGSRAFTNNRTGTEEYSFELLKALAKMDWKNHYTVYLRPGNHPEGIWPRNFEFKMLNYSLFWTQVGLSWQTFLDNLDVLFVPAHTLPLIRKPGLKTVMTIHDLGAEYLPSYHQLKQALYLKFITKIQLKTASQLIAVSNSTKEDLVRKIGIAPKKITVIYEGGPVSASPSSKERDILKKFEIERHKYFLFIGTIQPRKNLERLIKAFGRLALMKKDLKLILAGQRGWKSQSIYELPKKLGIEAQVVFPGFVSNEEKAVLMQNALAFVYPSLFEGFGLPILESFKYGCPVLTSNISSMPEVAGDGAILVDPYSIESIKEGMIEITKQDKALLLKRRGEDRLKDFSWEKCARETLKLFENVAK